MAIDELLPSYINLWAGEKQGVGKSWCTRLDAQRHVDYAFDFCVMDEENQFKGLFQPKCFLDRKISFKLSKTIDHSIHPILSAAITRPMLVNCQAGTNNQILRWIKNNQVAKITRKADLSIRYFFVSDLEPESLSLFEETAKMFAPYTSIIFVANYGRNQSGESHFESEKFQAVLKQFQAPVIRVGLLDLKLKEFMEEKRSIGPLWSWENTLQSGELWASAQADIDQYLESFYYQIDNAERLAEKVFDKRVLRPLGFAQYIK